MKHKNLKKTNDKLDFPTGLKKLVEATESVNELSRQLAIKEQELEVASKKADEVLTEVTQSAQAAEVVKTQVQKVKDKAQKIVDEISVSSSASFYQSLQSKQFSLEVQTEKVFPTPPP